MHFSWRTVLAYLNARAYVIATWLVAVGFLYQFTGVMLEAATALVLNSHDVRQTCYVAQLLGIAAVGWLMVSQNYYRQLMEGDV